MKLNANSKCPYCGASLMQEEDGYRCRLCKSFFPFESEQTAEAEEPYKMSVAAKQAEDRKDNSGKQIGPKEFIPHNGLHELIGILTALGSAVCLAFFKLKSMPLLMIPGFILWAFSAGFTAFQVYKAKKTGYKASFIRVGLILVIAILVVATIKPIE